MRLCRNLLAIFLAAGWLKTRMFFPCDAVGVHPVNRDGVGLIAQDVYDLGGDILCANWDDKECANAICVEAAPEKTHILDFTQKVARESNGRLPAADPLVLRYGALACNHTSCFLRCILHGKLAEEDSLAKICHLGALSVELLKKRDSLFASRVTDGMQWDVLVWQVESNYGAPCLQLISEARNMGAQLARRENVFQVVRRMYLLSAANPSNPDWGEISQKVLRSKPPCGAYLSKLIAWVARCAGTEGWALEWLVRLVRANENRGRAYLSFWRVSNVRLRCA